MKDKFIYSWKKWAERLKKIINSKINWLSLKDEKSLFKELKKIDLKSFNIDIIENKNWNNILTEASINWHFEIVKYLWNLDS